LPDILISADANTIAVRGGDGRLAILRTSNNTFAAREWLAADGDARAANEPALAETFKCDGAACIARLGGGGLVSLVRTPAAFEEDCRNAVVVISPRTASPACAALVIDRAVLKSVGAVALRRLSDGWDISVAR